MSAESEANLRSRRWGRRLHEHSFPTHICDLCHEVLSDKLACQIHWFPIRGALGLAKSDYP
jgi:hypothetical protein